MDPILLSVGECGAASYFFGALAAGTGPRMVAPVWPVEKSPVLGHDLARGRFSRDFSGFFRAPGTEAAAAGCGLPISRSGYLRRVQGIMAEP